MSLDLEKRTERLEKVQDRVFTKIDELHVAFVALSSKVGNGLTTLRNPLIFDFNVLHGCFEGGDADSYIVAVHVNPPEIGNRPSMKVNGNTAAGPRWFHNALKSRQ